MPFNPVCTPRSRREGVRSRCGFTRVELVGALAIAAMIAAWMMVAGERARRTAMLGEDLSNLRQIATLTGQCAADNDDKFWTFSWQGGETYNSKYPELNFAGNDLDAADNQAVEILRDSANRPDMPKISLWYAHLMYSHLPLLQFSGLHFPNRTFISSGDSARLLWASDPVGFDQNKFGPNQPPPNKPNKRWPYSSSYQLASSFFDRSPTPDQRLVQVFDDDSFVGGAGLDLQSRLVSSVVSPSQKVHLHDKYAWHFGTSSKHDKSTIPLQKGHAYFADEDARMPLLFVDGHAAVQTSHEANHGWVPSKPTLCQITKIYSPSSGLTVPGRYRWTRGYLEGRDVGGPESPECQ